MILTNERSKDNEDVGVLFHALIRYVEFNAEKLDRSLVSVGYGNLLDLANTAAESLAQHCSDEGEDWDGVVWFERLEDTSNEGLAASLLNRMTDTTTVVQKWLRTLS